MTHEELRQAVFERDNYTCHYCGRCGKGVDLEIDHIIPVSKGGTTDMRNLITACRACNRAKRNRLLTVAELQEIADKINSSFDYLMSLCAPAIKEEAQQTAGDEAGKVRVNFLLNGNMHEALMSLAYLKGETLTAIMTEAIEAYITDYAEQIAVLRETRRKLRGE